MKKALCFVLVFTCAWFSLASASAAAQGGNARDTLAPATAALALGLAGTGAAPVPAEYVGEWTGSVDNIRLSFAVGEDGAGTYTFEQAGYRESYAFTLTVESETFTVQIPADNPLGITACEGAYAYADGVLTLEVQTTLAGGRVFSYTVPCVRAETEAAAPESGGVFPVDYAVYGNPFTVSGYEITADEDGGTLVAFRALGIVMLKTPDGRNTASVSAVFDIGGETVQATVDSCTLRESAALDALYDTPLLHEFIFKLDTADIPDRITLIHSETGETVLSFTVADTPQMVMAPAGEA